MISVIGIDGIGKITSGDRLHEIISERVNEYLPLTESDCLVVASKVVAKAQGRVHVLEDGERKSDVIIKESRRVIRHRGNLLIAETNDGFICANAGIDESNTEAGTLVLLPYDADSAAHKIRKGIEALTGSDCAVVISDTFGRPFRMGETNVALGYSGLQSFADLRGTKDLFGRELNSTMIAIADEIASAAELVMHKSSGICVALVRGLPRSYRGEGKAKDLVRPAQDDLFR